MNRKISIALLMVLSMTFLVSAGDFNINYGGSKIFTVATSGNVNASGTIAESGVLLSETYLALTGGALTGILSSDSNFTTTADVQANYFVGDGSKLTGITIGDNSTEISINNVTDVPTCGADTFLKYDGSVLSCVATAENSTVIAYQNVTGIPTCGANEHLEFDGTDLTCTAPLENSTVIAYQNVTGIPTCGAGDFLKFSGGVLSCDTPSTSVDWTNKAFLNQSQTFSEYNEFTKYVNITEGVRLMSDTAVITRDGIEDVNVTIDSSGNINFNLG